MSRPLLREVPQTGNLHKSLLGQRRLKRGYTQVFGFSKVVGSPTRATRECLSMPRRLDPQLGLHAGVGIPIRGYTMVFGSPTGARRRSLESQPGLHTSVWIPNRGYTQLFGIPTGATHECLDPQPGLHTGVCSPNWGYTRVFGVPNGRLCKLPMYIVCPESQLN